MDKVCTLAGAVTTLEGTPVRDLNVAASTRNRLGEVHLGAGKTDSLGGFRVSLTASEVNLHLPAALRQSKADIQFVFSVESGGNAYVVHRHAVAVDFEGDSTVELGDIQIADWDLSLGKAERIGSRRGSSDGAMRLHLDRDLAIHCLSEVAPKVEKLTGWEGLLDDVQVDVTNDYRKSFSHLLKKLGVKAGFLEKCLMRLVFRLVLAQYEPFSKTIIVHKRAAAQSNLDGLKVILGHELVHVGQFQRTPELLERYKESLGWLTENTQGKSFVELVETMDYSLQQHFMSEMEGYAVYVQRYLEHFYTCAEVVQNPSMFAKFGLRLAGFLSDDLNKLLRLKAEQYEAGLESYRQTEDGRGPVPFRE